MTAHATLNGTIVTIGDTSCDERGFDWGYSSGSYPYDWTELGSFGTGSFSHVVTGLPLEQTVYFRAKAHNAGGWGYGSEKSFVTPTPFTFPIHVPFTRILLRPIGWCKLNRLGAIFALRRPHKKFEAQQPAKWGE